MMLFLRSFILNVVGLITEYNPFHNGHLYHMKQAIKHTNADFCIVVMSGNFVQRGTPAIIDKYSRTKMALEAGADLVLELPMPFACASAEIFAHGAVSLLDSLGVVTDLCFGSECADKTLLSTLAVILCEEPSCYRLALQQYLKEGDSFPKARMKALLSYYKEMSISIDSVQLSHLLSSPNNILGIEYLKALHRLSSSIRPVPITRVCSHYHSTEIQNEISSATAIRRILETKADYSDSEYRSLLLQSVPQNVFQTLIDFHHLRTPICANDLSSILNYCFLTQSTYADYAEWTKELSNRVAHQLPSYHCFDEWASLLKSKNITHTRICRSFIHLMTKLTNYDMEQYKKLDYCCYARMLGFRTESAELLSAIKKHSQVPIISKPAQAKTKLDSIGLHLFEQDVQASHLYNQIVFQKFGTILPDEYRANIIRLS